MRRRALLPILLVALLAAFPVSLADHPEEWTGPPHAASVDLDGPLGFAAWTSAPDSDDLNATFPPGGEGLLHVTWRDMPGGGNTTYNATVSLSAPVNLTFDGTTTYETGNVSGNDTGGRYLVPESTAFTVPNGTEGVETLTVNVTVYEANTTEQNTTGNETRNVTTWERVHEAGLDYDVTVQAPVQPPAEGPPWLLIGGLVAAGAAAAGGAIVYKRRQGPRAPRRSQALQELEAEDDEEVQQQVQEQRSQERKTREMRILEAKAEDHREGIERARQRLEEGEITEHQFERIKERKESALEDVLDELEEKRQELDG